MTPYSIADSSTTADANMTLRPRTPLILASLGFFCVLIGISACSSEEQDNNESPDNLPPLDNVAHSGTRLVALWDTPVDGEARFLGFYDASKKTACSFMLASDGEKRCLPAQDDATVDYEDEDCEVARLWWKTSSECESSNSDVAPPSYASTLSSPSCPATYSVYEVGKYLDDGMGKEQNRLTASGLCQGGTSDASSMKRYALGDEDDIHSWVKGEAETIQVEGSRIHVQFIRGEDGSYVRTGQYDAELETGCTPESLGESGMRCVPDTHTFLADTFSSDDACESPVATTETRCDENTFLIASPEDNDACPTRSYFERKKQVSKLYGALDCEPVDLSLMSAVFYEVGEQVKSDALVKLSPDRPTSPRLVRERFQDARGQVVEARSQQRWYDNHLELLCEKQRTTDGKARCVPGNFSEVIYKDDACELPVTKIDPCNSPKHVTALDLEQLNSCSPVLKVYAVGKAIAADSELFVKIGTDCAPFNVNAEGSDYRNVKEVAPETFAAFED